MEERQRLGSLLIKLAGVMIIIRGGNALLYRSVLLILEKRAVDQGASRFSWELEQPYWHWIVLVVLGLGLVLASPQLNGGPKRNEGSLDLSIPAMGLMLFLGLSAAFVGLTQIPATEFALSMGYGFRTEGVAGVLLGASILCFAPSISRSCRSISIADLYSGGLIFTAAYAGLWKAASLAGQGLDRLFTAPPGAGASLDHVSLLFGAYTINVFSCLLVIAVMIRMSIVGWPWVWEKQPEGDFIAPIVSYSALSASLALYWPMMDPITLIVLTTLGLLIGTHPQPVANLVRKLLVRFRQTPEPEA